jgi:hypothetical protein
MIAQILKSRPSFFYFQQRLAVESWLSNYALQLWELSAVAHFCLSELDCYFSGDQIGVVIAPGNESLLGG